jgi:hypothetical protein
MESLHAQWFDAFASMGFITVRKEKTSILQDQIMN